MPAQTATEQISNLQQKVNSTQLPQELAQGILARLQRLNKIQDAQDVFDDLDRITEYTEWATSLPWNKKSDDILDLSFAKKVLDKNHYGLQDLKNRILEFMSVMRLNKEKVKPDQTTRAPILFFVGLVGTGKTTIAYSIAQSLGRKIARIPFGGMGSPLDLRGQSRVHPEAEPGQVIKAMRKVQTKNPVILLDEIDRVAEEGRSSIMGVLVELLDPEQNHSFLDHYIDYPFDLSEVLFVATANNTTKIATAVLDRLEIIQMPSYTDEEKIMIGKNYMLPRVIKESGLPHEALTLQDEVWPMIVRPLGYDAGIRTLERTIEGIVRKIAREYVEGRLTRVVLTTQNIKQYLPT